MSNKSNPTFPSFLSFFLLTLLCIAAVYQGGSPYPSLTLLRLGVLSLAGMVIWLFLKTCPFEIPKSTSYPYILLFVLFIIWTTVLSPYKNISIEWGITLAMYIFFFGLTLLFFQSKEKIWFGIGCLLILGMFEALLGIVQFFILDYSRAKGTFFNPNFFGGFLVPIISLLMAFLFFKNRGVEQDIESVLKRSCPISLKGLAGICVVFMVFGLFLSGSRGAILSFLVSGLILLCVGYGKKGFIGLFLFFILFLVIPNPVHERLMKLATLDLSSYSRFDIWTQSWKMLMDHPKGVGLGMFKYYWPQYNFPLEGTFSRFGRWTVTPHNEFLQIGVEMGFAGLGVFLLGLFSFGRDCWKKMYRKTSENFLAIVIGLATGMIGTLCHSFVDSNFHEPAIALLFSFSAGLLICIKKLIHPEDCFRINPPQKKYSQIQFYKVSTVIVFVLLGLIIVKPMLGYSYSRMGDQALKEENLDLAARYYENATWWDPGKTQYHSNLSATLFLKYVTTKNVEWVNDANFELVYSGYLNPKNEEFPRRLGYVYSVVALFTEEKEIQEYLYEISLGYYGKAIELNPFQTQNFQEAGKIHLKLSDFQTARGAFEKALELEPFFLPSLVSLGQMDLDEGHIKQGANRFSRVLELYKNSFNWKGLTPYEKEFLKIDIKGVRGSLKGVHELNRDHGKQDF